MANTTDPRVRFFIAPFRQQGALGDLIPDLCKSKLQTATEVSGRIAGDAGT